MELRSLTRGQSLLATTASATPFIGLFGTVWGILVAFQQIGVTGSTSIVAVAPGIAEALINTAAGLAAAIPALIAYNHFNSRLRGLRAEMDDFAWNLQTSPAELLLMAFAPSSATTDFLGDIDVTPLVDVMLVLLIIFMVTHRCCTKV
jgi:hypothetical protein